jgi:hypothetical protein
MYEKLQYKLVVFVFIIFSPITTDKIVQIHTNTPRYV